MKARLLALGMAWLLVAGAASARPRSAGEKPAAAGKPNIVFFLVDDMGWQETSVPFHTEVTALNRRYHTPNMERLAAEGMKFTQAYASAVCSPTRVSALTGMNVARHRVTNWTLRKNTSPDPPSKQVTPPAWNVNGICTSAGIERTMQVTPLPALLHAAGYRTIHVGKAHFGAQGHAGREPAEPRLRREHRRACGRRPGQLLGREELQRRVAQPESGGPDLGRAGTGSLSRQEHLPHRGADAGGDQGGRAVRRRPAAVLPLHGALRRPRAVGEGRPVLPEIPRRRAEAIRGDAAPR